MRERAYLPLTEEVGQLDVLKEAINNGGSLEGGGRLLDSSNHVDEEAASSLVRGRQRGPASRDQFLISRVIWPYLVARGHRGVVTAHARQSVAAGQFRASRRLRLGSSWRTSRLRYVSSIYFPKNCIDRLPRVVPLSDSARYGRPQGSVIQPHVRRRQRIRPTKARCASGKACRIKVSSAHSII